MLVIMTKLFAIIKQRHNLNWLHKVSTLLEFFFKDGKERSDKSKIEEYLRKKHNKET